MPKALTIEQVNPAALNPAAYNPRKMSDSARAALRRGIEAFGLVDPIIARRSDNLVIGGHQRLTAQGACSRSERFTVGAPTPPCSYPMNVQTANDVKKHRLTRRLRLAGREPLTSESGGTNEPST